MKLVITCNTWEEEVRNATIHTLTNELTLTEFKVIAAIIARAIERNDLEHAEFTLWTYSEKDYTQEHIKELISDLRATYEQAE